VKREKGEKGGGTTIRVSAQEEFSDHDPLRKEDVHRAG